MKKRLFMLFGCLLFMLAEALGGAKAQQQVSNLPAGTNPGGILKSTGRLWKGEIRQGANSRYARFESVEYGYRAMFKLLQNYQRMYACNTVEKIISRWAPYGRRDCLCRQTHSQLLF